MDALERTVSLPRWNELPDLELYMDQVLSLVSRYLGALPGGEETALTAAMVNNYVKLELVPPPVKKRYGREQLSRLLIVSLMKSGFPIPAIKRLLDDARTRHGPEELYEIFRARYAAAAAETAAETAAERGADGGESPYAVILRAALRAQTARAEALRLFAEAFPEAEKTGK